jgi:hypothetical protein
MTEEERALAAKALDRAAKTAKNNLRNHLAVLQLVNELERHVREADAVHVALAPLFARVRAGSQLTLMEVEG